MNILSDLNQIRFYTNGVVRKEQNFQYFKQPCYYAENTDRWTTHWNKEDYLYLWELQQDENGLFRRVTPPTGMRSAVPLGGLGSGTLELRADGSFKDCNIFNNLPGRGEKIHMDDAMFGVKTKINNKTVAKLLRTHLPQGFGNDQCVDSINYSGAFPLSRLVFNDSELPVNIILDAFCRFVPGDPDTSSAPVVLFNITVTNPTDNPIDVSLLFNLPNVINGSFKNEMHGYSLSAACGNMAVSVDDANIKYMRANDLPSLWYAFGKDQLYETDHATYNVATIVEMRLHPGETQCLLFTLAWYFPDRIVGGCGVGQFYRNLYINAYNAAFSSIKSAADTIRHIVDWNKRIFKSGLPESLAAGLINTPATFYKTGLRFKDGTWRQFESFSCPNVSPLHIELYRSIPLTMLFPSLQKSLIEGYASFQDDDGYIREDLGNARTLDKNKYKSRKMGDSNTAYILYIMYYYKLTNDDKLLNNMWPGIKKAVAWQVDRCKQYDLPANMLNTYDWWDFENKDSVAYNTVLHLAAMKAAQKLAQVMNDQDLEKICADSYSRVKKAFDKNMWNGAYYNAYWNNGEKCNAIHADTLYGQLWAYIVGLGEILDHDKIISHLENEQNLCGSPYGLKVMRFDGRDDDHLPPYTRVRDNLIWEAGSLDWCAVGLFAGLNKNRCLEEANKILYKWDVHLADSWDVRDLSAGWDGYPWCNSHYSRQLIMWAIPNALGIAI